MPDDPHDATPTLAERADERDPAALGALAHRMNNAVSYVITNLHLLAEELDEAQLDPEARAKLMQLIADADAGTTRIGELIRRLRVLSWGSRPYDPSGLEDSEDTWDDGDKESRILIVDDEPHILTAVGRALKRYECTLVGSGSQALDLLRGGASFDLILCDLIMRRVSGIELFEWVLQHRPELGPRIMFITAGAFTPELRAFLARVGNTVLHKPFDTKTLRWMVAQKLRGSR